VFAGTFTNGGLRVAIEDGQVNILQEGRNKKFLNFVEQITFSGKFAQKRKQPVYYVTERCVFQLKDKGLELIEVAPGIDIDKHILPFMDFKPIINDPQPMDKRIFIDEPMGLLNDLINLNMSDRVTYDPDRNILFVNLEGWNARTKKDIDELRKTLVEASEKVGKRVNSVVNHDGWKINEALYDDYAEMIEYMSKHYYLTTTRYATSAFARLKMKEALTRRGLQPHVFERREAAETFLQVVANEEKTPA
jgi:propionate CoA-transferase